MGVCGYYLSIIVLIMSKTITLYFLKVYDLMVALLICLKTGVEEAIELLTPFMFTADETPLVA